MARFAVACWRWVGAGLWSAAILLPFLLLLTATVTGPAPSQGWSVTDRQLVLLLKTAGLAGAATVLTFALALPAAYALGRAVHHRRGSWTAPFLPLPLLVPPYVYAFGWDGVFGPWLTERFGAWSGWIRAACVWAGWAWPVPTMILVGTWQRIAQGAYQACLLDTRPARAFRRMVLPILAGHVAAGAVILWVVFMIEYTVPHACSIQVFATELLAWAQAARHPIDVVWPSLPMVGVVLVAATVGLAWRRGLSGLDAQQESPTAEAGYAAWYRGLPLLGLIGLTVLLPLLALVGRLTSWQSFAVLWRVHSRDLLESSGIAVGAGVVVVWVGTWLADRGRRPLLRRVAVAGTILFGLMPPALVGEALVNAYRPVSMVYDQWPIMVLTQVARWGWIGWLASWVTNRSVPISLVEQARADGADQTVAMIRVGWRMHWPILACAGALTAAMALAEVAAMSMVRPPGIGWIALTLMEKFHRLEDQMLVTISLVLTAAPFPAMVLGWLAWQARGRT